MIYTDTEEERETTCHVSCKGGPFKKKKKKKYIYIYIYIYIIIAIILCLKSESFVVLTCLVFVIQSPHPTFSHSILDLI
jgi:accessory gene regulator protein AgrB